MNKIFKKKTKIVATIGPSTESEKQLDLLVKNGVNVLRLNFSHNTHDWHQSVYNRAKRVSKKHKEHLAIMQDLSGPKIRTGKLKNDQIILKKGQKIILTTKNILGTSDRISVNYKKLPQDVTKGGVLKIEDGKKELRVDKTTKTEIYCTVIRGGILGSHKGINVPGAHLSVSSLTTKDKKDVLFGIKNKVDFIALSFVQRKKDILELRKILEKNKSNAKIIAKIETEAAVKNIDEIIEVSDGVMVARGDMAIEVGTERVPIIQKLIIKKCNNVGKPVITATQMLDSMEESPVPTRAEVSDIANAILDGTDAIMLSGETTIGKYPIEAVKTMTSIAQRTELYNENIDIPYIKSDMNLVNTITRSAVQIADNVGAQLIVTFTESGSTAKMVARFKPSQGVLALTPNEKTARAINISYGCKPIIIKKLKTTTKLIEETQRLIKKNRLAKKGDKVVVTMGYPIGVPGTTNKIFVIEVE